MLYLLLQFSCLYIHLTCVFICQSKHNQETLVLEKQYKAKQALQWRENRKANKSLVVLTDTLSNRNKDLELVEADRSYHISVAINDAKREERCHYTTIVQAQKDQGHKLKSASMVSRHFPTFVNTHLMFTRLTTNDNIYTDLAASYQKLKNRTTIFDHN